MFGLGTPELLFITVIVMVLFGGKKIPEMLGGLGKGIKNFKKNLNAADDASETKEEDKNKITPP